MKLASISYHRSASFQLLCLMLFVVSTGCNLTRANSSNVPIVFNAPPDLGQIVSAVNGNSDRVMQLHSSSVRLSIPGQPGSFRSTIDFDRAAGPSSPGRYRLSGNLLGTRQLDLGSNDNEYWMWVKMNKPPTVFWGRHSQFFQSAAQQFLPMPPSWLIDALGMVHLDQDLAHHQLYESQTPGLLQIHTRIPTPRGDLLRILEIDAQRALIVQQEIYDGQRLLAIANSSDFRMNARAGVTLPHSIQVKLPPAGLSFDFKVDNYVVNQPVSDPDSLWRVPEIPQHRYLDLANPNDMQGVNLLGSSPDFYDRSQVVSQPAPVEPPRTAWRDRFSLRFLR